jgi:branched-chain amino acid transport system permease protein
VSVSPDLSAARRRAGPAAAVVVLAAGLAFVEASGQAFWQGLIVNLAIFMILVLALNVSSGFTGVFSLGHIGFMALGAYMSAILTLPLREKGDYLPDLPSWLAGVHLDQTVGPVPVGFLVATLIAATIVSIVAFLVGRVLMRLSGHFVAVATLGFLVIVRVVLFNADAFTRGSRTFSNVSPYTNLWWAWAWVLVAIYIVWRLKRSPYGREMFAQRDDPVAAQAVGVRVMEPRLLAFVVGAFFSAVAGALYAHFITSFSPTVFYFDLTFRVITMLVIGGMGSVSGSILGAVAIIALAEGLRRIEDTTLLYGLSQIILAVIFIFIITFRRDGLLGQREVALDRLFVPGWRERRPGRPWRRALDEGTPEAAPEAATSDATARDAAVPDSAAPSGGDPPGGPQSS